MQRGLSRTRKTSNLGCALLPIPGSKYLSVQQCRAYQLETNSQLYQKWLHERGVTEKEIPRDANGRPGKPIWGNQELYKQWLKERRKEVVNRPSHAQGVTDLSKRIKGIEETLGYSFNDHEDLLALLPQYPEDMSRDVYSSFDRAGSLDLLGHSVLKLAMRQAGVEIQDKKDISNLFRKLGLYKAFIDHAKPLDKLSPTSKGQFKYGFYNHGFLVGKTAYQFKRFQAGIFGVVFRDGGMGAVNRVLLHIKLLELADPSPSETTTHQIGMNVNDLLMTNALHGKVKGKINPTILEIESVRKIEKMVTLRCTYGVWPTILYNRSEVSKFIGEYTGENLKYNFETATFTKEIGETDLKWLKDLGNMTFTPAAIYRFFLGFCYLSGGLDLVREMLNRFDPGYNCPRYPKKLQEEMIELDRTMRQPFWG